MMSRQFLAFLVAGGTAALANIGSRALFSLVMPYVPAIVLAYCVGMVTAFVLNRMFVFRVGGRGLQQQAMWFVIVNLAAVLQTLIVSVVLARWILPALHAPGDHATIAHVVGVIIPVITSYVGHKHLTFKHR